MKNKQTMFFVTLSDITPILKKNRATPAKKYFEDGVVSDDKIVRQYHSALDIENLGFTDYGNWNASKSYLVIPKNSAIYIEDVPQRKGGLKYAVHGLYKDNNIEFKPCGIYQEK